MKRFLCSVLLMTMICTSTVFAAPDTSAVEKSAVAAIDKSKATIVDIEKKIWDLKEMGMEEVESSKLMMDLFEKEGFKKLYS